MFNFLKKKHGIGFLPDQRPLEAREKDYKAEEVFIFKAVNWREKPQSEWKTYPIFDQQQTSSCVSQTLAKVLAVENILEENKWIDFSRRDIYSQGFELNGGMFYDKALDLARHNGITLESLLPSTNLSEDQIRKRDDATEFVKQVALVGKPKNYIYLPIDFDAIANILDTGKAVCLGTRFNAGGFTPEVKLDITGVYGHAITVVDYII